MPLDPRSALTRAVHAESRIGLKAVAPVSIPVQSASSPLGQELPILDTETFDRWTTLLPPETIATYLETLVQIRESISPGLRLSDAFTSPPETLVKTAHRLAGSAGIFGLERVATVSRRFEKALVIDASDVTDLANGLRAAITATLEEIYQRTSNRASVVSC